MGLFLSTCAGLVLWVVLWSIGVKSFDAFMLTILIVLIAATMRFVTPYLPGNRPSQDEPS
jgi:hypothetical protein